MRTTARPHLVSPDRIMVPEWRLLLNCWDKDNIPLSLCNDVLYYGSFKSKHSEIHIKIHSQNTFDLRLWKERKTIAFWSQLPKDETFKTLLRVRDLFSHKKYVNVALPLKPIVDDINLDEYVVIFNCDRCVFECTFSEIEKFCESGLYPVVDYNYNRRPFHLLTPMEKKLFETKTIKSENMCYYLESCKYWEKRIGNMDVAEWHLLMYEE